MENLYDRIAAALISVNMLEGPGLPHSKHPGGLNWSDLWPLQYFHKHPLPKQRCVSGSQAPILCWTMPAVPDKDPNLQLRMASSAKQKQSYICDICLEDAKLMPWATSTKNRAGR